MSKKVLTMRQIKEVLRLRFVLKMSHKTISESTGIPKTTIGDYLMRSKAAGLVWPLPSELTEEEISEQLFPGRYYGNDSDRPQPDWNKVHEEIRRKGVTLQLLWEEYKRTRPDGYQYSWFAEHYRAWARKLDVWMPQTHKAGDKTFVDFSGLTVPLWDARKETVVGHVEIFVGVLGASDLIFCYACPDQKLPAWIDAHCCMFEFFGGSTLLLIPDNIRTGVTKPHRYEPRCQRTYEEMARHYGAAIMPARTYRAKDKAKVEQSVQHIQRRILAPLRDQRFTTLETLNDAIAELLADVNERPFQKLPTSRRELFERIERSALQPLSLTRYEYGEWCAETLKGNYHVCIHQHYYSVPYIHVGRKIESRVTSRMVECFYQDRLVACHQRDDTPGEYTTVDAHRPEAHRQQALWHSDRLESWATHVGGATCELITRVLHHPRRHLQQRERSALGILRLSHAYSEEELEKACQYALYLNTERYDSLASILKRGVDSLSAIHSKATITSGGHHANVRGPKYYH